MPTSQRIRVLEKYQPFARLLAVFNIDNFVTIDRHLLLQAASMSTLLVSLSMGFCFAGWSSIFQQTEWSERAFKFAAALSLMQQFVIYVLLARNNRQITGALEQLQQLVDERKISIFFHFRNACKSLCLILGQGLPSQSRSIYEQVEQQYSLTLNRVKKFLVAAIIITYGLPLAQPLSYVLFSHPDPNEWELPNGFRWISSPFPPLCEHL